MFQQILQDLSFLRTERSNMSTDHKLGQEIGKLLVQRGIETPMFHEKLDSKSTSVIIRTNHSETMKALGLNMNDDSLCDTPKRIAKMYTEEVFYGLDYGNFPSCTTIENKMKYDEVVAVGKIDVLSLCEHHFVPFIGHAYVAYIPETKVLGLSKFNRVVDFFSRRPQVQERLNAQIHAALTHILGTQDVAVVIHADHMCVKLRGVKQDSFTATSKITGRFMTNPALRAEFFALTRG